MSEQPRPDDDTDDRPWERFGAARRDSAPHRGPLLRLLGLATLGLGLASLCCFPLAIPLAPLVLGVSLTAELLARRDLRAMEDGRMDIRGLAATVEAGENARAGELLHLLGWLLLGLMILGIVLLDGTRPPR
jgi:hypothetical protein